MRFRNIRVAVVIGLALTTAACTSNNSMVFDYGAEGASEIQKINPDVARKALESAPLCCTSLSELAYQKVTSPGKLDFAITPESKAFKFSTGKSFVKGIELPESLGSVKIAVSSPILSSVFVPTVLVLDERHQPVQVYGEETIQYDEGSILNGDRYFGEVELAESSSNARYLVILTTEKAVKGATKLAELGDDAIAMGHSRDAKRIYQDQPVPHTAIGAVRLAFDYQPANTAVAQNLMVNDAPLQAEGQKQASQAKDMVTQQAEAVASAEETSIQPETEAKFIKLIKQAVKEGKLNKAMNIVKDAEGAGSTKARDVFISSLQKAQQ